MSHGPPERSEPARLRLSTAELPSRSRAASSTWASGTSSTSDACSGTCRSSRSERTPTGRDAILAIAGTRGGTGTLLLDARVVRASPDAVKAATRVKGIASPELVDAWIVADETRRRAQTAAETLRAEQRKLSDRIGALKRQLGGRADPELEGLMARGDELKLEHQALADSQAAAEAEATRIMLQLPAIPDPTWPVGADAGTTESSAPGPTPPAPPWRLRRARRITSSSAGPSASSTSSAV